MRIADPFRNSKTQIQVRSRKSREYVVGENHLPFTGSSVFVHFKRGPGLAPHRYRENGKRRDAPPGSSLRASNARFHYRHPTSRLLRIVYFARYADAGARVTQLYTQPRSVLTRERILENGFRSCPVLSFLLSLNAGQDSLSCSRRDVGIASNGVGSKSIDSLRN